MYFIQSTFAAYTPAFQQHPAGTTWAEGAALSYPQAFAEVQAYLREKCGWQRTAQGLAPEGHEATWFAFGATSVQADGEFIALLPAN
jgi:hypothetical protein